MISYEEFTQVVSEEIDLLPAYVFTELSGGILVKEDAYLHPRRVADDLYILGTYSSSAMGKQITLYYGSFQQTMSHSSWEEIRAQIRETLRHEFRHHLEARAGIFGRGSLIEEDNAAMARYYMRHKPKEPPPNGSSRVDIK